MYQVKVLQLFGNHVKLAVNAVYVDSMQSFAVK